MIKLFRYLKHYKLQSILGPLFKLTEACFELIVPIVMAKIIDVGIASEDSSYVLKMGGVLVLLGVLGLAASLTAQFFAAKASLGFGTELRRDLFRHIGTFSHKEIDRVGSSTLVTRMTVDINQAQTGINMLLRLFLRSPFIVIGAIIMAFTISVKLTLIFLIASPLLALMIFLVMKLTVPMFKRIQKRLDKTTLMVGENLSGVRVIRAFSRQKDEEKQFKENADELLDLQIKAGRISALTNPCTYLIVYAAIIVIIWFGGVNVNIGGITQGELIALISYMNQILLALLAVALLVTSLTRAQASSARINEVFEIKPSITDEGNTTVEPDETAPAVCFENVSFSYHDNEEYALKDISFTAAKGETVGIIGGTGCGKSTLVSLIPRFYECSSGSVKVKGSSVKIYPFDQLRGLIGYVPQKAELFRGTIRDNMRYRKRDATDEEITEALDIAQALSFVSEKPDGLDTVLVSGGKNLSGGQRQRLTVARALVGRPEILILDDSASALDLATDAALRKAIAAKTEGMTVFIVSQRVSSIRYADKILVLDDGVLAGIGTHEELLQGCELYSEICQSQQYTDGKGAAQ
ncbi:ATP-binding cassette, subfamily B [Ruminococcaceae bacterium FB2012]|nr:ATP-binding cassette, subfamily B [Ruminococcaceae bacterium FB2012]